MIHSITRHAAQQIWHHAMTSEQPLHGLLLTAGDCIVGSTLFTSSLDGQQLSAITQQDGWQLGGFFYCQLPDVATALEYENMLDSLAEPMLCSSLMHVHLDLASAGLLKMAAYTLVNDRLIPVTLSMETD